MLRAGVLRDGATVFALCAVSVVLRLARLDAKSLWNDEAFSVRLAELKLPDLYDAISSDVHPPLYYFLLSLWLDFANFDHYGRLFSALTGCCAVVVFFLTSKKIFGFTVAAFASAHVSILPLYIAWSQTSRQYSLLLLLTCLAVLASVLFVVNTSTRSAYDLKSLTHGVIAPEPPRALPPVGWAAVYVLAMAGALWTHNLALLLLVGINVGFFWHVAAAKTDLARLVAPWLICQTVVVALWAPWWPQLLAQAESGRLGAQQFLVSSAEVLSRFGQVLGGYQLWTLAPIAALLTLFLMISGASRLFPWGVPAKIILCSISVPVGTCLVLYIAGKAAFGYAVSNLIWVPALSSLLIAANFRDASAMKRPAAVAAGLLFACLGALTLKGLLNWYETPNPPWDVVADRIAAEARVGDAVVALVSLQDAAASQQAHGEVPLHSFRHYWGRARSNRTLPDVVSPVWDDGSSEALLRWMDGHERIWIPGTASPLQPTRATMLVKAAEAAPDIWRVRRQTVDRLTITLLSRVE